MKRLTTILLLFLSLATLGQTVHFYPTYTDTYAKVPGQEVAVLVRLPKDYGIDPAKKWPFKIFVHGMGQRGPGTIAALKTVYEGPVQAIPEDWKTSCDQNGIVGVLVNYNTFFQPASLAWTINFIKSKYSVVNRPMGQGFSWGGGALQKFYCTDSGYAAMLACAVPIAPTIEYNTGWQNPGKAKLPVIAMVNSGDSTTKAITAFNSVKAINLYSPAIPATYLEFPIGGHGGTNEGLSNKPPLGLAETIDQWYLDILANGPRPPKKGTGVPPADPDPDPDPMFPVLKLADVPSITTTGTVALDGCKSTGYEWFTWTVITVPKGANVYSNYFPGGAGNCKVTASFTMEGAYSIKATACKGSFCVTDTLTISYQKASQPVPIKPLNFDGTYVVFSDGTRVRATARLDFVNKKASAIGDDGITYTW